MPVLTRRRLLAGSAAVAALAGAGYLAARQMREASPTSPHAGRLDPARLRSVPVAPRDVALTFARLDGRTMLVDSFTDGIVRGVDLSAAGTGDAIGLMARHGYEALAGIAGPSVEAPADALGLPFDTGGAHIGFGANYPAHGTEVAVEAPFVFPKLVQPTPAFADVMAGTGLLDYEVELGLVALTPIRAGERPRQVGLALVGDYTDRATLLRELSITDVDSGNGFGSAKSNPGFLPVGPFLVVPREPRAFLRTLRLELHVDNDLRQVAEPRLLTWDLDRMLVEAFARADRRWPVHGAPAGLPIRAGVIEAGTILLSGTPDGVVFRPPGTRQIALGVVEALAGFQVPRSANLFEATIREARAQGLYLQPGQTVTKRADYLGIVRNRVV